MSIYGSIIRIYIYYVLYRCIFVTGGIENIGPTKPASKDAPGTLSRSGSGESWRRAGGAGGAGQGNWFFKSEMAWKWLICVNISLKCANYNPL